MLKSTQDTVGEDSGSRIVGEVVKLKPATAIGASLS